MVNIVERLVRRTSGTRREHTTSTLMTAAALPPDAVLPAQAASLLVLALAVAGEKLYGPVPPPRGRTVTCPGVDRAAEKPPDDVEPIDYHGALRAAHRRLHPTRAARARGRATGGSMLKYATFRSKRAEPGLGLGVDLC